MNSHSKLTPHFSTKVLTWFDIHGRKNLPWQQNTTAYRVWISEIMLQQTQVATVIPYFNRFMQSFPTVEALAKAKLDDVFHHWSGLGYYARAKNLHKAAQIVVTQFNSEFPQDVDAMETLPGIGKSTAGAIISIAYKKRAVILDGNVKRVLARHEAIAGWAGKTNVHENLWQVAEQYTPKKRVEDYTQAMMDLGATVCTRSKPNCIECPLNKSCAAFNTDRIAEFPAKKPKKILPIKQTRMLVIRCKEEFLLQQRQLTGIWPGLWGFIEIPIDQDIDGYCQNHLHLKKYDRESQTGFRHTFSHYHLDISIEHIRLNRKPALIMEDKQALWYNMSQPQSVGLASPVSRILKNTTLS